MRTRVKICGIRSPEIARLAVDAGADAIGLVFYPPSPRNISVSEAIGVARRVPAFVTRVGLFVDPDPEWVMEVLRQVDLDLLQFHGEESNRFCRSFGRPFIKAVGVEAGFSVATVQERWPDARAFLLDRYDPVLKGGTGQCFDWREFPRHSEQPLILAGGLTPQNVRQAVDQTGAYAVDVSGGVESEKGIKSPALIREFLKEVNRESSN